VTGAVTQLGQSALPGGWSQAANAISPWLLAAFLVGAAMPGRRSAMTNRRTERRACGSTAPGDVLDAR
jgi:hypothetical protein